MIIPSGEYGQVNFIFSGTGMPSGGEVTCGFRLVDQPDFSAEAAATAFAALWSNSFLTMQSSAITLAEVRVKYGPNATGPEGGVTPGVAGSRANSGVPPNTSLLVRKSTAGGGRRARGRMYIPGLLDSDVDVDGFITPATVSAFQTEANEFFDGAEAGGLPLYVLHAPGISATPAPTVMTGLQVQGVAATQRRRMRR